MKILKGSPPGTKPTAALVIGDGPTDETIIKEAAKHYNHKKTITMLDNPQRKTGLQPALERAYYIITKLNITKILLVIDREHLPKTTEKLLEKLR